MRILSCSILAAVAALSLSACKKSSTPTCPRSFADLKGTGVQTCSCTGGSEQSGSVYGTDLYTTDSSICSAAKHAGVIDKTGNVSVAEAPGCDHYVGSARNGVTTVGWDSYPKSFYFTSKPQPACPGK